jgi:predicted DNA binding CopG/RHH family protein
MNKPKVPAFRPEAEEARWWDAHREEFDRILENAARHGRLKPLSPAKLLKRAEGSRVISIRLRQADLARLRRLAAQKGLPYQTYMKSLLHEALAREEKRRAG